MPMFETTYYGCNAKRTKEEKRQTQLWARDEYHAEHLIHLRKMGEIFTGSYMPIFNEPPYLPTELLDQKKYGAAMHSACWLGMVATASGSAPGFDLLSDEGPIHSLAHIVHQVEVAPNSSYTIGRMVEDCYQPLLALQRATPGFDKEAAGDKLWTAEPEPSPVHKVQLADSNTRYGYAPTARLFKQLETKRQQAEQNYRTLFDPKNTY